MKHGLSTEAQADNLIEIVIGYLFSLRRRQKRLVLVVVDSVIFSVSLLVAYWLRLSSLPFGSQFSVIPYVLVPLTGVILLWMSGFYRTLIRAFEFRSVNRLFTGCLLTALLFSAFAAFTNYFFVPRSVPYIFFLLAFVFIGASRVFARWLYLYSIGKRGEKKPVLIYGANEDGNQIANALSGSPDFSLVGFFDADPTLAGNYMRGRRVYRLDEIDKLTERFGNLTVFLSFRDLSSERKRTIYRQIARPSVKIEIVPPLSDLISGKTSLDSARELRIEDLLGRQPVPPVKQIFSKAIKGATVLVTGGGGSIGSELCRQILSNQPGKLIILEQNEFALHQIQSLLNEIQVKKRDAVRVIFRLGDANNRPLVRRLLDEFTPDFVFHAAAYKHVPIVEENIVEGVRNNILATAVVASECKASGVRRFTLISTDKAVRPTNVMGATKRVAELIVQAHASKSDNTIFSMVRFGNVLGSSGSVIPVFMEQIKKGGPVTVTHRDITRYFMTIPEAAQLVIQASFMAEGGEVFVLDMGNPVKILDLAHLTIQLSGHTVKDEENPDGDIEIEYTGLRPGEKLYEELLISEQSEATIHPKIVKAHEEHLSHTELGKVLSTFEKSVQADDPAACISLLKQVVPGFKTSI